MSAHAVSLAERDRLGSFVVPFIPPPRAGSEIDGLPLKDLGPDDTAGEGMIGRSAALRQVVEQVRMVASTDSTVLICGETGTGKELIARGPTTSVPVACTRS
jgi:transcriptional regulator of aromatic amino acid metabolism